MDLQSFLASGLIESYVLGQCTPAERSEVERMAEQYPEVRTEIAATEQALEQYAQANALQPPAWMKGRILDLVGRDAPPASAPFRPSRGPRQYLVWGLMAASLLLFAGVWLLNSQKRELQNTVATLRQQTDDCAAREQQAELIRQQVAMLRSTGTKQLPLKDSLNTALAYYNDVECKVAIDLSTLPPPNSGKFYQFWAIVDGKPKSMGMVSREAGVDWQSFPCADGAVAYAISEEDDPKGHDVPTTVRLVGVKTTG